MSLINLTTLFGINAANNALQTGSVNFRGSEKVAAFEFEGLEPNRDRFSTNPLYTHQNKAEIEKAAKSNQRIMSLLKEHNIPLRVNIEALEKLQKGHLADTRVVAAKIYSALPANLKKEVNLPNIQQAAMLHDYGKVLIPKEILDKKGSLTQKEREIIELHSEFGYELLKDRGLNEEVLSLIKYHHQKPDGSGYPAIDKDYINSLSSQILMVADKFSALTENRSYHKACENKEALQIIQKDVENGTISQEVFDALKKSCL